MSTIVGGHYQHTLWTVSAARPDAYARGFHEQKTQHHLASDMIRLGAFLEKLKSKFLVFGCLSTAK